MCGTQLVWRFVGVGAEVGSDMELLSEGTLGKRAHILGALEWGMARLEHHQRTPLLRSPGDFVL